MNYFNNLIKNGFSHSIDMITLELLGDPPRFEPWLEHQRVTFTKGDVKTTTKYGNYKTFLNFEGVSIEFGAIVGKGQTNKDVYADDGAFVERKANEVVTFPKTRIRFNPNKMYSKWWFGGDMGFLALLNTWLTNNPHNEMWLKKYDYAIDVPFPMNAVNVKTRKEQHTFKGTRYYGSRENTHGYLKVYDKKAERRIKGDNSILDENLTRIEYTFDTDKPRTFDDIRINKSVTKDDYEKLCDTDRAIVDLFTLAQLHDIPYDLKLGRGKMDKLKDYLFCDKQIVHSYDLELLSKLQEVLHFSLPNEFYINHLANTSGLKVIVNDDD